jgi:hypothetical protein
VKISITYMFLGLSYVGLHVLELILIGSLVVYLVAYGNVNSHCTFVRLKAFITDCCLLLVMQMFKIRV